MTHETDRNREWAATAKGFVSTTRTGGAVVTAHADGDVHLSHPHGVNRKIQEEREAVLLAPGATLALGAGNRAIEEEPDEWRTCFERDRDRILHASAFRRLAGKTQVFVFPDDHQRTRLTHALEVAQVATGIARPLGLNLDLAEAIALGHDCGHGPGGHASEDAFDQFLPGGFNHAIWGADVSLAHLNLCVETLDGIRNHSWSLPSPMTPEAHCVSWADRIGYLAHDFEDAVSAGIVTPDELPEIVAERLGRKRSKQIGTLIDGIVRTTLETGTLGMDAETAEALTAFRVFNYEQIYMRDVSVVQSDAVIRLLTSLVEFYILQPSAIPDLGVDTEVEPESDAAVKEAVSYVAGMTDRFACQLALEHLGYEPESLPRALGA